MLRNAGTPTTLKFVRGGGSIVVAEVDIWRAGSEKWELVTQIKFSDGSLPEEAQEMRLPDGAYTCIFKCFVQKSLNGNYEYDLSVAGKDTFMAQGEIDSTTPNLSKLFQDQFVLNVKGEGA